VHFFKDFAIGELICEGPHILGHEFGGVVEEVGSAKYEHLIGKRVAVEPAIPCLRCEICLDGNQNCCPNVLFSGVPPTHGAYREYVEHPGWLIEPVPDHLTDNQVAMLEPLAIAVHIMDLAKPQLGKTAAILGVGTIGQMILEMAKKFSLAPLIVTDRLDYRLEIAKDGGATHTINIDETDPVEQVMDLTQGRGVDYVFEASTGDDAYGQAIAMAKPAGKVFQCGIGDGDQIVFSNSLVRRKGLSYFSVRRSGNTLARSINILANGHADVDRIITHEFPLAGLGKAFSLMCDYDDGILKSMIRF